MNYPALFLAAALSTGLLAQSTFAQAPPKGPKPAELGGRAAQMDREFLTKAAMGNLLVVELSRAALEKSGNREIKTYSQMMTTDHGRTNAELKVLAAKKGVPLASVLDGAGSKTVAESRKASGPAFDRGYVAQMVQARRQAVLDFERTARETTDSDIRDFANKTLMTLKGHLNRIEELERSMS